MKEETLRKIARLALDGMPGERDVAIKLLKKMGTTADKVLSDPKCKMVKCIFTFKTKEEEELILQNYFRLTKKNEAFFYSLNARKKEIEISADLADEFQSSNKTILGLWRKQIKNLLSAFIIRHELHSDVPAENPPQEPLTEEEEAELLGMISSIRHANLGRLLK